MRIKTRIQLGIFLSFVLAATIALLLFLAARTVNELSRLDGITAEVVKGVAELKIVTHEYILHTEERSLMQWRSRYSSLSKLLTGSHFKSPDQKIVADQILKNLERFKTVFSDLTTGLRKGEALGQQESSAFRELQDRLKDELLVKSQLAVSFAFQLHQEIEAKSMTIQKRVYLLTFLLLLTLTAAIVGISLWVNRSVARPIAKLEKDTQIIGSGNLDHRVGTTAKDEIGELSRAFDKMTQDLKETTTSIVELNKEIDERKQAEEALRKSKTLLTETGRMAKIGGWEVDSKTLEVSWTEETYRIHEIPLGHNPQLEKAINFFHPDDRQKLETAIQKALEHGEPYDMEIRFITAKGKHLWTHTICKPITVGGKTVKLTGTFQDITERKQNEAELEKYKKHLETLVKEQTKELEEKVTELERMNDLFVGREFRIKELRDKIQELEGR